MYLFLSYSVLGIMLFDKAFFWFFFSSHKDRAFCSARFCAERPSFAKDTLREDHEAYPAQNSTGRSWPGGYIYPGRWECHWSSVSTSPLRCRDLMDWIEHYSTVPVCIIKSPSGASVCGAKSLLHVLAACCFVRLRYRGSCQPVHVFCF